MVFWVGGFEQKEKGMGEGGGTSREQGGVAGRCASCASPHLFALRFLCFPHQIALVARMISLFSLV